MTTPAPATGQARPAAQRSDHGLAYDLFILVLTVYSLVIMGLLVLPLDPATLDLLRAYDNFICVIFLIDFGITLRGSHPRRAYLIGRRGWLDLLGSIPSLGFLRFTALFRLFRLSRLGRILRNRQRGVVKEILANRSQYALFVTVLSAFMVLTIASVLILQFEQRSPNANIITGGDALWWALVTITTVGYGDFYPVTGFGRVTATFVMFSGVGIIGALASILASVLLAAPSTTEESSGLPAVVPDSASGEISELRAELDRMHQTLRQLVTSHGGGSSEGANTDDPGLAGPA